MPCSTPKEEQYHVWLCVLHEKDESMVCTAYRLTFFNQLCDEPR
ncbi:hypothetical protein HMPREF9244_01387 [Alloscardovia omnicolens F0580]|uniref:Uncharacterized protein n=1 Tax=Alloscardovia omnicolens F0580 TaxID=1321816 RepID=U1R8Q8_9BIFI|nr:hypothetical protein HMPREF9244_01387 [Alloscardovia omnicolens F0580]